MDIQDSMSRDLAVELDVARGANESVAMLHK
jgi:hypothetical protein